MTTKCCEKPVAVTSDDGGRIVGEVCCRQSKFKMTDLQGNTVIELFEPDHHRTPETYDPMTGSYHSESDRSGE